MFSDSCCSIHFAGNRVRRRYSRGPTHLFSQPHYKLLIGGPVPETRVALAIFEPRGRRSPEAFPFRALFLPAPDFVSSIFIEGAGANLFVDADEMVRMATNAERSSPWKSINILAINIYKRLVAECRQPLTAIRCHPHRNPPVKHIPFIAQQTNSLTTQNHKPVLHDMRFDEWQVGPRREGKDIYRHVKRR